MGIFRSEIMIHKKIRIPKDTALEVMNELGKLEDAVEFIDLTKDDIEAKKNFGMMIKRCDEMEKKINNFEKIAENYGLSFIKYQNYDHFTKDLEEDQKSLPRNIGATYFDYIENLVNEDERKILELIESYSQINDALDNLIEKKSVFDKSSQLVLPSRVEGSNRYGMIEEGHSSELNFIAGVIKAEDDLRMKRMIFRISRGRAVPTFFELLTDNKISKRQSIPKKIFTIFFQGGVENVLMSKLIKVCDIFGASRFSIPSSKEMQNQINLLQHEIAEKNNFLRQAETSIRDFIKNKIGYDFQPAKYDLYRLFFKKERLIFVNLNKCILQGNFIDGEIWIPEEKLDFIQDALRNITRINESKLTANMSDPVESDKVAPTFIKTDDLTFPFQEIVNTYGVPRYREINPALFAIITFPFLFGVMFGDIGHGFLLMLFGLFLVFRKDDLIKQNSPLKAALKARYLLLFMGFFAFYAGWMYNDFLSIPLGIFGTCYKNQGDIAVKDKDCVYPFGIDPKWYVATNELAFFNSLKMKVSVILGVTQMSFGIVLKGMNALYFGNTIDFIFEFIPQIIFMLLLFGYMVIMIFIKWSIDWTGKLDKAPSIITLLMKIFLNKGSVDGKPIWGQPGEQENFHFIVLIICGICVPIMLFPKPIIQYMQTKKKSGFNHLIEENENVAHHEEHGFGEIFVHQAIETIEFVLGAISNTASYLRLWALSLAHAQLARVFFEKSLMGYIHEGNVIMIVIGFFIFANVTFFVLMCMDLMECFLHTLRLHWVEFQNKFYKADGYKFSPYSFKYILGIEE